MIRTACLLMALLVALSTSVAQEGRPGQITLRFSGDPAEIALEAAAREFGLVLDTGPEGVLMLDMPVWLSAESVSADRAARLLSIATGLRVSVVGEKLLARETSDPPRHLFTRGYDVSVAAGRFVEYVNEYGEPAIVVDERQKRLQWTAAEHLSQLVAFVAWEAWSTELEGSVVGDRLLITADAPMHGEVAELLQLLISDSGGESSDLGLERVMRSRLAKAELDVQLENVPMASVIATLCRHAQVDFVLDAAIASDMEQTHIDYVGSGSTASQIAALLEREYDGTNASAAHGALHFMQSDGEGLFGLRVFELTDLLKRTAAAYARQRTQPDREEGYEEDLRQAGGVYVILRALTRELDQQSRKAEVRCYGTRLVVAGAAESVDAAEAILKEMGWEMPADSAD